MEARRKEPWNSSFKMLGWNRSQISFFTCDCCGKDHRGSTAGDHRFFGFPLDNNPQVTYWHRDTEWNKKYCENCYKSGVFHYQALIKKNNEVFANYQEEVSKKLLIVNQRLNEATTNLQNFESELEAEKGQLVKKVSELESAGKVLAEDKKQLELKEKKLEEEKKVLSEAKDKAETDTKKTTKKRKS
jgi:hypothetical protein